MSRPDPQAKHPDDARTDPIRASFEEAAQTLRAFLDQAQGLAGVNAFADAAAATLSRGGLLMSCGNGCRLCACLF